MGTRMGPIYANLFVGNVEHQFLISTTAPNPLNSTAATSTTASTLFHPAEKNSDQFITSVNSFLSVLTYSWEISETSLAFLDIKVSISGNVLYTSVHELQTYRFSQLFVVFIVTSITCQELHSLFSIS